MLTARYDLLTARRALVLTLACVAIAYGLTSATDEGDVSWATRWSRTAPILPLASALGAWLSLAPSRVKQEIVALEALGRPRVWSRLAATLGAVAPSLLVATMLATGRALDLSAFFPRVEQGASFEWDKGRFVSRELSIAVSPTGELARLEQALTGQGTAASTEPRWAVALAVLLAAVALALIVTREGARRGRFVGLSLALAASLLAFQAAAVHVVPDATVVVVPTVLFLVAAQEVRRELSTARDAVRLPPR